MKKLAIALLSTVLIISTASAFSQGHDLNQIFKNSGSFSDCGNQLLAGNGSCVMLPTSSSGDQQLEGFTRNGDQVTLELENGGQATFTDREGSSSGSAQTLSKSTNGDDITISISNGNSVTFTDDTGSSSSGDGYIGNERNSDNPHTVKGPIEFEDGEDWGISGTQFVLVQNSVSASQVNARNELCLNGVNNCVGSWDELVSDGDGYLPEDGASSNVNMDNNELQNVDTIKAGGESGYYQGGFGASMSDSTFEIFDSSGAVRFSVLDSVVSVADDMTMNGKNIEDVGSCSTCDLAETVEKSEDADLEKGDVVSINDEGELVKASEKYDSEVAGVVSSSPVIMMGAESGGVDFGENVAEGKSAVVETEEGKKEVPLALAGLVPVKASAVNGEIEEGDKLTTSGITGHAVKAEPLMTSNGRKVYGSGIIGKALEPLEEGEEEIEMLVSVE